MDAETTVEERSDSGIDRCHGSGLVPGVGGGLSEFTRHGRGARGRVGELTAA